MARIKYAPGITPLTKKHHGYTFQSGRAANTMGKSQANDRARNGRQNNAKLFLINAVTHWRSLSPTIKLAWSNFALAYPQPSKRNPTKFLSGYQNFIKRSSYLFLNYGIETIFDEPPLMTSLAIDPVSFSIDQSENCIDCSAAFIANFGMLPKAGDFLLLRVLPMAVRSGQYFEPFEATIECTAVYIDGLFLSLHFPTSRADIVYSIFLSKPVNPSTSYVGTKTRYMGCFTSKKFIDLSDTPKTYAGQAGKVATVRPDETGLEFKAAAAGGLTCADLINCPKIISMDLIESNLITTFLASFLSSIPAVKFGSLFNFFSLVDPRNIAPPGWHVPSQNEWATCLTNLGGASIAGGKMKDLIASFWNSPNTGAINMFYFNARGSGRRRETGIYTDNLSNSYIGCSTQYDATQQYLRQMYAANATVYNGVESKKQGVSLRCIKDDSNLTDRMTGNDFKLYRVCKIGNQIWQADNSNETLFRDGTAIPLVTDATAWSLLSSSGRCYPLNDVLLS